MACHDRRCSTQASDKLTKLFSTQTDGWNAAASFHASCDGQGPTVTLVRRVDHRYYGGYASRSWTTNGYKQDAAAFLFRFHKEKSQKTVVEKFKSKNSGEELYGHKSYGPVFGSQHDLCTFQSSAGTMLRDPGVCESTSFELPTSPTLFANCHYSMSTRPRQKLLTTPPLIDGSIPKICTNFQLEVLKVGTVDNVELKKPWLPRMSWLQQVSLVSGCSTACHLQAWFIAMQYLVMHPRLRVCVKLKIRPSSWCQQPCDGFCNMHESICCCTCFQP